MRRGPPPETAGRLQAARGATPPVGRDEGAVCGNVGGVGGVQLQVQEVDQKISPLHARRTPDAVAQHRAKQPLQQLQQQQAGGGGGHVPQQVVARLDSIDLEALAAHDQEGHDRLNQVRFIV